MADDMSIDNLSKHRDESEESIDSPPETDQNHAAGHNSTGHHASQDGQQPKRKGGRKPVRHSLRSDQSFYLFYMHSALLLRPIRGTRDRAQVADGPVMGLVGCSVCFV